MSTATISELGSNLRSFLAAVQVGDTVAVTDNGKEIARLVPPVSKKTASVAIPKLNAWAQQRLDELNEIFPEPVLGVGEIMDDSRADLSER